MKVPVEIVAHYLPYGVKAKFQYKNKSTCRHYVIGTLCAVYDDGSIVCHDTVNATPDHYRLVLIPLDCYKDINSKAFTALNCDIPNHIEICDLANKQIHYTSMSVAALEICLKNHIDVFGLIEQGLAIKKDV